MTGWPAREGSSRISTAAKKAAMSTWRIVATVATGRSAPRTPALPQAVAERPPGDQDQRLDDDPGRHLGVALGSFREPDRHLGDGGPEGGDAVRHFDLEAVAVG